MKCYLGFKCAIGRPLGTCVPKTGVSGLFQVALELTD